MAFAALAPHQEAALLAARSGLLAWKLSDMSWDQKPCDMMVLYKVPAYVAVMFYERGQNDFWLIPIDEWVSLRTKKTSGMKSQKSFREEDCREEWRRTL